MHKTAKQFMVILLIAAMIFIPFGTCALAEGMVLDDTISGEAMAADFFIVRPLGIVTGFFLRLR